MDFAWLPRYAPLLIEGFWRTIALTLIAAFFGTLLAIPVALAQVSGGRVLGGLSRGFTTTIRGTPLLVQIYLLYYGVGDLLSQMPEVRQSFLWPYLREGFWYAVAAFTISVAAYEGEIFRGGLLAVPRGELEAARAFGMSRFKILRRVWLPRALHISLPALSGEAILLVKATPLASTVTVIDLYGAAARVRADTFRVYEPLLLVAGVYIGMTLIIALTFRFLERRVPSGQRL
jgi:polar amino acid transport system permease protein